MEYDLIVSVVLFHNKKREVEALVAGCKSEELKLRLVFVDNAPGHTDYNFNELPAWAEYRPMAKNLGYGRAHNQVIMDPKLQSRYFLIANPDIRCQANDLKKIFHQMENSPEVQLLMPKIIWPNGQDQGLRKLLPQPSDLFLRRFLPGFVRRIFADREKRYQMQQFNPNKAMEVPVLSGCFMFCRGQSLRKIGGFDPRFFLYLEDVDLSRRLGKLGINLYWPEVEVVHEYQKSSYVSWRALRLHLQSAWRYFNKYGWFYDKERREINRGALSQKQ